ncbi:Tetratricopeptide repeat-containing domain-containing protein [Cinnamomum micranthum f. kanehirae]|uniref:Tetratricopeptide repeat-containing domain-containing protein n=1 Tax=Cinnamomum micranthum f. kanehirae TaxID=337451 RepID=A0A3S3MRL0_9MAGN|nr:Tetratricopeptide repeat-containing domain-containing protein [Cinnamomum micranthum f. kanehirae]
MAMFRCTINVQISGFYRGINSDVSEKYGSCSNQSCKVYNIISLASKGGRGFGPQPRKKEKFNSVEVPREGGNNASLDSQGKLASKQANMVTNQSPGFASSGLGGKSDKVVLDRQFEERLEAIRRSALEQRKAEEVKAFEAIDYDAPVKSYQGTVGLGTKVGVGVAVVVFGLVFALGDFLPSGSVDPNEGKITQMKITEKEKAILQARLQQYEATLKISPNDSDAIEGAAVTLAELGEYNRAASLLESLIRENPNDSEAFRLLGEIKYELKDYEGSVAAYRSSASASETTNLEVLRGLTNSLLAAQKPEEAVQLLIATQESLNSRSLKEQNIQGDDSSNLDNRMQIDPIQVELLLGKAYSDWGHVSDAASVYDRLISMYPNDFRGYLAKGILLKENGEVGGAERMFIQARFFAPEKAKALVDRYSRG